MKKYLLTTCKTIFTNLMIVILVGCSNPIPPERANYIGEWSSSNMLIEIAADGGLYYERKSSGSSTMIDASISEFDGDDFIVSFFFASTTFKVSQPPAYIDGQWTMVVDGVKLTKQE